VVTILVIEDDPSIRESTTEMLEIEGFAAVEADNGERGVELAVYHRPDLIICDIALPGMDGYEVLNSINNMPETRLTPFIFLSAHAEHEDVRKGMRLGADDFLTDPLNHAELISSIKVQLAKRAELTTTIEENLETAKQTLIRIVAHELRTPLVSLKMIEDIISLREDQSPEKEIAPFMDVFSKSTRRMSHLVEQMVLTAEIQSKILTQESIDQHASPVEVGQLLEDSIALGRNFATRETDVLVELNIEAYDTPVMCAPQSLKHALAEILTNAFHFSDGEPIAVAQWNSENSCRISVTDSGPGMSPETIEKAMRPFEQIDRDRQEQQGFGMGLSLACQIIYIHGGEVGIRSVIGKGTTVTVILP
jgi:two-component system sensor histidine kinase/response regulator